MTRAMPCGCPWAPPKPTHAYLHPVDPKPGDEVVIFELGKPVPAERDFAPEPRHDSDCEWCSPDLPTRTQFGLTLSYVEGWLSGDFDDAAAYLREHADEMADQAVEDHCALDDRPPGCDCSSLCEMGPTCPGGMLARLPGSGCSRTPVEPLLWAGDQA